MDGQSGNPSLLRIGRTVGDYVLLSELGRGGFGVVYEAKDQRDGSRVALKCLQANLSSPQGQRALTRFLLEVRAVRQIKHPNIVKYIDGGEIGAEDGSALAYYAMELLPGETLDAAVRREGPLHPVDAASVIRQSAVGLYTAHQQGIIHRDIKPGNIMLSPSGRAVVTDFGVCKIMEIHNVTTAGQVVGTARYLSPEQFLGAPVDQRSDVFALGALLFFLLTGEHLRVAKDIVVLSRAVAAGEDLKRAKLADNIPGAFKKVLLKALSRDPAARYQDCLQLAHALEEACLSREIRGMPPPPRRPPTRRVVQLEGTRLDSPPPPRQPPSTAPPPPPDDLSDTMPEVPVVTSAPPLPDDRPTATRDAPMDIIAAVDREARRAPSAPSAPAPAVERIPSVDVDFTAVQPVATAQLAPRQVNDSGPWVLGLLVVVAALAAAWWLAGWL